MRKKSALTVWKAADGSWVGIRFSARVERESRFHAPQPDKGGVSESAADWTPGNCERRSRSSVKHHRKSRAGSHNGNCPSTGTLVFEILARGQQQFERQQVFRVKAGIETCTRRMKVLTMRPVPVSSTSAMAMVATTSKLLRRWREEPAW